VSVAGLHLPNWLLRVFILTDRHAHDFTAFFKVFDQLLLVSPEVNIFNKHTAGVGVIFERLVVLAVVEGVWLGVLFVYIFGYLMSHATSI
jgi:hypothetical protein